MAENSDLKWALAQYSDSTRARNYTTYANYYDGKQKLRFASDKFRSAFGILFKTFSENVCPAVVDSLCDRLKIVGFRTNQAKISSESVASTIPGTPDRKRVLVKDPDGQKAWDLWQRNRMDLKARDVHREAIREGDSYVIVWPDENMQAAIWPQLAGEVYVQYDPNTPGRLLRACKLWFDVVELKWRLNVYTIDGITKYISREKASSAPTLSAGGFQAVPDSFVPNPYGRVPVFHFARGADGKPGRSDLADVIPLQDALNKSVMDMLVAMEFASYKQRYIIGLEVEIDEETGQPADSRMKNYGVDRMMAIPDADAKVGQFDATDLGQFLRVQEKFWASVARVSGTPLHYFFITSGDFPSGEAQKAAEARFSTRIEECHTGFGNTWVDVMAFAMEIDGDFKEGMRANPLWKDATPRSDSELADTAVKKKSVGVPRSQLLREMGYSDEQIEQFLQEADAESVASALLRMPQGTNQSGQPGEPQQMPGDQKRSTTQPTNQNTRGVRQ